MKLTYVISKRILEIDDWGISCEIALIWMSLDRQQAITWANVDPDLCRHMASLGHNEVMKYRHDIALSFNNGVQYVIRNHKRRRHTQSGLILCYGLVSCDKQYWISVQNNSYQLLISPMDASILLDILNSVASYELLINLGNP